MPTRAKPFATTLSAACALCVIAVALPAAAQGQAEKKPEKKPVAASTAGSPAVSTDKASGYEVMTFPNDKLLDSLIDPNQTKIVSGHTVVRVTLSRPRVSFVPELLKTIEQL